MLKNTLYHYSCYVGTSENISVPPSASAATKLRAGWERFVLTKTEVWDLLFSINQLIPTTTAAPYIDEPKSVDSKNADMKPADPSTF